MRTRRLWPWLVFALGALLVLEALGWVTWRAVSLERRERLARAEAEFQQLTRLALWRMESELLPIIAQESARPYFHYRAFYPAQRAYARIWQPPEPGEPLEPSPLLEPPSALVRLHYQIEPNGELTSPQVPAPQWLELATPAYIDREFLLLSRQRLDELRLILDAPVMPAAPAPLDMARAGAPNGGGARDDRAPAPPPPSVLAERAAGEPAEPIQRQQRETADEFESRKQAAAAAYEGVAQRRARRESQAAAPSPSAEPDSPVTADAARHADANPALADASDAKAESMRDAAGNPPPTPAPFAQSPAAQPPPAQPAARGEASSPGARAAAASPAAATSRPMGDIDASRALNLDGSDHVATLAAPAGPGIDQSAFEAVWITPAGFATRATGTSVPASPRPPAEPQLVLQRRVVASTGESWTQGLWIDWPALRERLLTGIRSILPGADVSAMLPGTPQGERALRLASLPVLVHPGPVPPPPPEGLSATGLVLILTWLAVLAAIAAIGYVLHKAMDLSDRRGRFVSAVTHELRTPLTTFNLYTEMLEGGLVPPPRQAEYLRTLREEARRLSAIVENVLAYARLGRASPRRADLPELDAADLLARVEPTLRRAADAAGLDLRVSGPPPTGVRLAADVGSVERILINLLDNAAKYAHDVAPASSSSASSSPAAFPAAPRSTAARRVDLDVRVDPRHVAISVRDFGPGIPPRQRRRIFRPFHRAVPPTDASPGLGLGLALARGLARDMGGDLILERSAAPGACFTLLLPRR